jgi:hypothetical protein
MPTFCQNAKPTFGLPHIPLAPLKAGAGRERSFKGIAGFKLVVNAIMVF